MSILQGVGNQAGRLLYSCTPGSTVQRANKGDNGAFSSFIFISCARQMNSPCSLLLPTTQSSPQTIPYLWPQHVQLHPLERAWASWFINEWTVNTEKSHMPLAPCHPGPSFIKFHVHLDPVHRSASKSVAGSAVCSLRNRQHLNPPPIQ